MNDFSQHEKRPKVTCFEDLFIWQKAIEFAKEIYLLTNIRCIKNGLWLKEPNA